MPREEGVQNVFNDSMIYIMEGVRFAFIVVTQICFSCLWRQCSNSLLCKGMDQFMKAIRQPRVGSWFEALNQGTQDLRQG